MHLARVVVLAESRLDEPEGAPQRHWSDTHRDVVVVGHHTPGKHRQPVALADLFQQLDEALGLIVLAE
jgi:hypothetical protein